MSEIDYQQYSLRELQDCLTHINREEYPQRVGLIEQEIARRTEHTVNSDQVAGAQDTDFFCSHIASSNVWPIWRRFIGWGIVITLFGYVPAVFVISLFAAIIGIPKGVILLVEQFANILFSLTLSFFLLRKLIGEPYDRFKLVVVPHEQADDESSQHNLTGGPTDG